MKDANLPHLGEEILVPLSCNWWKDRGHMFEALLDSGCVSKRSFASSKDGMAPKESRDRAYSVFPRIGALLS